MSQHIRDIVSEDHRTAAVFEKHSVDFCCNGGKTLEATCVEKGISPEIVRQELLQVTSASAPNGFRPADWELDVLADFIVNNHHSYVRRMIPTVSAHLDKVVAAHTTNHPELREIAGHFQTLSQELMHHMQKEEMVLFPFIKSLMLASRHHSRIQPPPFGTIHNPIRMMEAEHASAGGALASMRALSNGYTVPSDGCSTFQVTYRELEEFEHDLHQHIHLENNILFPKSITLERQLLI